MAVVALETVNHDNLNEFVYKESVSSAIKLLRSIVEIEYGNNNYGITDDRFITYHHLSQCLDDIEVYIFPKKS